MTEQVDRYELLGELATGGMATVYLGRQTGPFGFKRTVAIKSMHPHFAKDEDFRAMFLDEATLTARIRHPNVVPTLDIVCAETKVLLVMEYIDGLSLSLLERIIRSGTGSVPPAIAVAIVCDVLHGLHAAHELMDDDNKPLAVVHRDVSPQNIHVGLDGLTRVLDFGIAKAATRRYKTQTGEVKGKLAYMSSEQLTGGEVDRRTDIYAAGVVLWELLTGRRMFDGAHDGEVIRLVVEGKADPPSLFCDVELPPALDKAVVKAVSLKSADRFPTADEMARTLAAALQPASRAEVTAFVRTHAAKEIESRAKRFHEPTPTQGGLEPEAKALLTVLMEHTGTRMSTSRSVVPPAPAPPQPQPSRPSFASASYPQAPLSYPQPMSGSGSTSSPMVLRLLLIGGATVVVLLLTGGAFFIGTRSAARTSSTPAINDPPPAAVTPSFAPSSLSSPPEPSVSVAADPPPSPPPPSSTAPAKKVPGRKKPGPTPATKKDCNPPFTVDAHGDRHYKPECVE